ncbi:MAG: hypothetical protein LBU95_04305, partial [Rikenellaceae bacterium]|nr:hypothetical protein [Rikenellaceae bacterium]
MRRISLTEEESQELKLLHKTNSSALLRERSFTLLLSDSGQYVNQIALTMNRSRRTVSDLLTLWEHRGSTAAVNLRAFINHKLYDGIRFYTCRHTPFPR